MICVQQSADNTATIRKQGTNLFSWQLANFHKRSQIGGNSRTITASTWERFFTDDIQFYRKYHGNGIVCNWTARMSIEMSDLFSQHSTVTVWHSWKLKLITKTITLHYCRLAKSQ